MAWVDVPAPELNQNVTETETTAALAKLENCFNTEADGLRRFYGISSWITLPDNGRVHGLHDDGRDNLVAVTSLGNAYRIDSDGNITNVTGVPVSGGKRPIFAKTNDGVFIAAGGPIVRLSKRTTDKLSDDAPTKTSHVAYIDNYVLAIEDGTFRHSDAGDFSTWDPLDTFAVNSQPDPVSALMVTPFGEVLLGGKDSTEQYERLTSGDTAFYRRWAVGEGIWAPYTMLHADNAAFFVNAKREFVRASGQTSQPVSVKIGSAIEDATLDWTDAFVTGWPNQPMHFDGQKFIVLQLPKALNPYGTEGLTFAYDYRQQKWFSLYGWDAAAAKPTRWPGWSHWTLWGQTHVGGDNGKIGRLSKTSHSNFGNTQRMLFLTAYLSSLGEIDITNVRIRMRRGVGSNTVEPKMRLRVRRDGKGWGRWLEKSLGKAGDRHMSMEFGRMGHGNVFQFEVECTDDCPVEIHKMQADATQIGHG